MYLGYLPFIFSHIIPRYLCCRRPPVPLPAAVWARRLRSVQIHVKQHAEVQKIILILTPATPPHPQPPSISRLPRCTWGPGCKQSTRLHLLPPGCYCVQDCIPYAYRTFFFFFSKILYTYLA